ncbi:MAG: hypothetical protein IT449_01865 [Phycisphaerales bacterium]|nr:hypothetical protein [Phycisphaerales bacterium]
MKKGTVAVIDVLGFKGICKQRHVAIDQVLAKMRLLIDHANDLNNSIPEDQGASSKEPPPVCLQSLVLSDTLVIACHPSDDDESRLAQCLTMLITCRMVAHTIIFAAGDPKPGLCLRGAIGFGDYVIDGPILMGEAIDDAAEHAHLPQGAFVWLTPRAAAARDAFRDLEMTHPPAMGVIDDYHLPLKGGGHIACSIVNPFVYQAWWSDDLDAIQRAMLDTFVPPSVDIQVKRTNTRDFLRLAADIARRDVERLRGGKPRAES